MKLHHYLFIFLIEILAVVVHQVQSQNQDGFISLDCGLVPVDTSYSEKTTGINYVSDSNFTSSGESHRIQTQYQTLFQQQTWFLRSFPQGIRNCFSLNLTAGDKYLVRASFVYGNYDNANQLPSFDLYIGPNNWTSVAIQGAANATITEIIHVLATDRLQVCLVKTGPTTPFISSLKLRPIADNIYDAQTGSLNNYARVYLSSNTQRFIRFPDDVLDRIWKPFFENPWTQITTTLAINTNDPYEPPQLALRTAAVPTNSTQPLSLKLLPADTASQFYVFFQLAEIELLQSNETREFNVTYNGNLFYGPFTPLNFTVSTIFSKTALGPLNGQYEFLFVRTPKSTRPPLLNAVEVYSFVELPQLDTEGSDVDAITNIKATYGVSRISWQGDPCAPQQFIWDGLQCSYTADSPRIISLNLSSSGLVGTVTPYIQNLTQLTQLDLSNNNLTGEVPDFLSEMKSLSLINLSQNQLNGTIPAALLERQKDGTLTLYFGGNPDICKSNSCDNNIHKKKLLIPLIVSVAGFCILLGLCTTLFVLWRRKPSTEEDVRPAPPVTNTEPISDISNEFASNSKERRFTYADVLRMTNSFERVLGVGGSGTVYHGFLNETEQVAVKLLSGTSAQEYKQFKAEVDLLLRVHHKNLVTVVGYCDEGGTLALIYEYMENGDLEKHLSGNHGGNILSWEARVRIAAETAQGLEYLHSGCKPPMVHRDVKTANLLLDKHFQAKLADFGLSRSFPIDGTSHVSTVVAGTPGYVDPEYYKTNWLTEKSDVYSFGILLLKIITNRPVIDKTRKSPHIAEWVASMLGGGDINKIMDPKLQENFNKNSAWRVAELAMACVSPSASSRPSMTKVVVELKDCLASEHIMTEDLESGETSSVERTKGISTELVPVPR